jgi:HD-like signal output (HDOD) protein
MHSTLPPPPAGPQPAPRSRTLEALRARARAGAFELPVLPESATQIVRLTQDESTTPKRLASTIEHDPALAAHLLRIANSPLHRPPSPIRTMEQAIVRMGFTEVRNMALAVACKTRVFVVRGYEADVRRSFRHSLAAALFAHELARGRGISREEAFLTGLLHDVGEPLLIQLALDLAKGHGETLPRAALLSEVHALHAEVGARLIRLWKLSEMAVDLTMLHHAPECAPPHLASAARMLAYADELADVALATTEGMPNAESVHPPGLGMSADDVEAIEGKVAAIRGTVDALS